MAAGLFAFAIACSGAELPSNAKMQGAGGVELEESASSSGESATEELGLDPDLEGGGLESGGGSGGEDPDGDPCQDLDDSGADVGDVEPEFSILWVANTAQGTISKVDTRRGVELARYRTGPSRHESPSRTSVNLHGDVAVANRGSGTVVKIAARESNCVDRDADGEIRSSKGPHDLLEWGRDECVLWSHDLNFVHQGDERSSGGPRALAWEPGGRADDPCGFEARVWVGWRGWRDETLDERSPAIVRRITADGRSDGETTISEWDGGEWEHGLYGAATDAKGNFWGIGSEGILVRVDAQSLDARVFRRAGDPSERRFYGLALDGQGNPWISTFDEHGLVKFDIERREFVEIRPAPFSGGEPRFRGLAVDRDYRVWIAGNSPCGLAGYDIVRDEWFGPYHVLPGCDDPVGVSIDHEGFVWVVDQWAERAYKVHPRSFDVRTVDGFDQPYTYSDMTGHGLAIVHDQVDPPAR